MLAGDPASVGGGAETSGWWPEAESSGGSSSGSGRAMESEFVRRHHRHEPRENQCSSTLIKHIKAPIHLVRSPRSLVRDLNRVPTF